MLVLVVFLIWAAVIRCFWIRGKKYRATTQKSTTTDFLSDNCTNSKTVSQNSAQDTFEDRSVTPKTSKKYTAALRNSTNADFPRDDCSKSENISTNCVKHKCTDLTAAAETRNAASTGSAASATCGLSNSSNSNNSVPNFTRYHLSNDKVFLQSPVEKKLGESLPPLAPVALVCIISPHQLPCNSTRTTHSKILSSRTHR